MNTSMIAMGVAIAAVAGFVITLGALSLLSGTVSFFAAKPRLRILKSEKGDNGFAFGFRWDSVGEPAKMDYVKIRLFNPFGDPTQVEVAKKFDGNTSGFAEDVDMGPALKSLLSAKGVEKARITVEVGSYKDGINFAFEMKAVKFLKELESADLTASAFVSKYRLDKKTVSKSPVAIPERSFIADTTIEGSSAQVKIATNPWYAQEFAAVQAGGAAAAPGEEVANFSISKVWIEPGCIVCNACEDIYPEVFDVQADTCYIRPESPMNDGLRIEEAADACPVEVIKFTKA